MYCIDTEAIAFISTCFLGHEKYMTDFNDIYGIKGSILVWTNYINYEKCIEHWFLAPWVYLCSTSLMQAVT